MLFETLATILFVTQGIPVKISDLYKPVPPKNPVLVTAILVQKNLGNLQISDQGKTVWVSKIPDIDFPLGATVKVVGNYKSGNIVMQEYMIAWSEANNLFQYTGKVKPEVSKAVSLYGAIAFPVLAVVRGQTTFTTYSIPFVVKASYSDTSGREYYTELNDLSQWVLDTDKVSLTITQVLGARLSWTSEYQRLQAQ